MQFRHFGGVLGQDEDEIHGVRSGNRMGLDLLQCIRLVDILRRAFEDRFETGSILKLFVGVRILVRL